MNNAYIIYEENDERIIERLIHPRFRGRVVVDRKTPEFIRVQFYSEISEEKQEIRKKAALEYFAINQPDCIPFSQKNESIRIVTDKPVPKPIPKPESKQVKEVIIPFKRRGTGIRSTENLRPNTICRNFTKGDKVIVKAPKESWEGEITGRHESFGYKVKDTNPESEYFNEEFVRKSSQIELI